MAEADNKETICWGILYTRRKHQAWIKRRRRVYGYECICKQAGRQAGRQQAGRQAGRQQVGREHLAWRKEKACKLPEGKR